MSANETRFIEEEEFSTQFNGRVLARMMRQVRPYWTWVLGFLLLGVANCLIMVQKSPRAGLIALPLFHASLIVYALSIIVDCALA